jgi:hypothetical protein
MVQGDMTTKEIIDELRDQADVIGPGTECNLLRVAADRLEALDERVDIMSVEQDAENGLKAFDERTEPDEENGLAEIVGFGADGMRLP